MSACVFVCLPVCLFRCNPLHVFSQACREVSSKLYIFLGLTQTHVIPFMQVKGVEPFKMLRWATTRAGFDEHIISIHISYHISWWHMHTLYNCMYLHVFASRWSHHTIETEVLRITLLPSPSNFKLTHWGKSEDMWQCAMCHLMFLLQQTGWTSIFVGFSVYNLRNFWSCCCWKGSFHRENWIKPRMKIYEFFRYTLQLQEFFQMFSPILTFKRGFGELLGPTCQIKVNRVGVTGMFPTGFSLGQREVFPWFPMAFLSPSCRSVTFKILVIACRNLARPAAWHGTFRWAGDAGSMWAAPQTTHLTCCNDSLTLFTPFV